MDYNTIISRYYYKDGSLYYRENLSSRARKDGLVGTLSGRGYYQVKFSGKQYKLHRVIYCYFNECGYDDIDGWEIDHLDNDRGNNRIENLILCEHWENQLNRKDTKENGCLWKDNPIRLQRNKIRAKTYYHSLSKEDKEEFNKKCSERRRQRKAKSKET